ncbi:AMP-binding protein [Undibacterium sp. TJN25]|uniref:AMP-binding protein n=1 Tax=Undibacterium sp. TJN25 TaxID=3413056 RepID=UPI003BEFD74B
MSTLVRSGSAHLDTFAFDHLPPREQWPDLLFPLPELQYPGRLNCVVELLDACVKKHPDKMAIVTYDESWSYAFLLEQVNRIAHVLTADLKLVPGNRVLLRGANNPMMAACILAVFKAGCIAVPTMPLLRARELAAIINKAEVTAALCSSALKEDMQTAKEACPVLKQLICFHTGAEDAGGLESLMQSRPAHFDAVDTAAEDVCLIAFTSGTTGTPKGTMHFHRDILAACDCFPRSVLHASGSDIFIGTPPLAFTFGLGGLLLFPLRAGATAVLLERLNPESLLQAVAHFRASVCFTAPTFYRQMTSLVANTDLSSLKKTVSAGEALPATTRLAWQQATGLAMIDGIGSTEMLHIFISAAGDETRAGATGKVVPGYQACILDDDGRPAPPGVTGRLAVKGPTGCRYLADARQANYVHEGWNLTGDAYAMDEDGYFWYRARTDDMIISAGYNIAGPEVEEVLLTHAAVAECAVIGWPDEERGQIVKAYVVLKPGMQAGETMVQELQRFTKEKIAPYKYPRAIEFRVSLPRTETGKLQRYKLRQAEDGK